MELTKKVPTNDKNQENNHLLRMLDRGIDDMEAGRELPLEDAFRKITELRDCLLYTSDVYKRQHQHRSRSSGNADPASYLGFYRDGTGSKPSRSDLHGFHNAPQPVLL